MAVGAYCVRSTEYGVPYMKKSPASLCQSGGSITGGWLMECINSTDASLQVACTVCHDGPVVCCPSQDRWTGGLVDWPVVWRDCPAI